MSLIANSTSPGSQGLYGQPESDMERCGRRASVQAQFHAICCILWIRQAKAGSEVRVSVGRCARRRGSKIQAIYG